MVSRSQWITKETRNVIGGGFVCIGKLETGGIRAYEIKIKGQEDFGGVVNSAPQLNFLS